jgi:FkbM family methyltransferase
MLQMVRSGKRRLRQLRLSVLNSARAFHPRETGYRLGIESHGGFEVAFRRGTVDEQVIADSFGNDTFFASIPEYRPDPGDVIVDVGAHIGTFALLAAARVPSGRVYAIEPSRDSYDFLRVNQALNRTENLEISRLALAGSAGSAFLYHEDGSWGHSITRRLSSSRETVPTETLVGFLDGRGIARCDLIKFNCEGAEFPVLLSTPPEGLRRCGVMLILYHCDLVDGYTIDHLTQHLGNAGFSTTIRERSRFRGRLVAVLPEASSRAGTVGAD